MLAQHPRDLKITERLKILHKRTKNLLIQIHYLKNTLLKDNSYFTKLCSDSTMEATIKLLNKKFPNVEIKTNKAVLEPLLSSHEVILNELQFHYNTLADVLEVKDNLIDLLGQISAFQYSLNIKLNTDMTRLYLDLVIDYASIMIILCSIPQIRLILIIYNIAFSCQFNQDETVYPRLCERLVEKHKDGCFTELYNEMNPYGRTLLTALISVSELLPSKLLSTNELEKGKTFQLTNILDIDLYNLLPLEKIHRWLFLGYLVIYPEILRTPTNTAIFRSVLEVSGSVTLFRDDVITIQPFMTKFCGSQKSLGKLLTLVKESQKDLLSRTSALHRSRRNYLRLAMRHQLQMISDQPGIMAPNIGTLCLTLANATDELYWLVTQIDQPLSKKVASKEGDLADQQLPEFLYQTEEIRHLLQQHDVINIFYKKVLLEHDLPALHNIIGDCLPYFSDQDLAILTYLVEQVNLDNAQEASEEEPLSILQDKPFKSIRLDWLRLQTFLSFDDSIFNWAENHRFVQILNTIIIHTHLVDNLPKFLNKFSSSKFLFFHKSTMKDLFESNLKLAVQHRYAIIFPRLCSHFISNCTQDCPEDFNIVLRDSIEMAHTFLKYICIELCQLMATIIKSHFELSQKSKSTNAIDLYHFHFEKRQKDSTESNKKSGKLLVDLTRLPGFESQQTYSEVVSNYDLELATLSQLSAGLNSRPLCVNNRILYPTLYLKKEIIKFLNDKLVTLVTVKYTRDKHDAMIGARRCTDSKMLIVECMSVVTRISEYIEINVALIFMDVFLSQSLTRDSLGRATITEVYCNWYLDFILNQPYILHSPLLKSFITIVPHNPKEAASIVINSEEFTDIYELQALVEVIGPYGMCALNERIMQMILKNISALRRFVQLNRTTLIELNVSNLDYNKIKKLLYNIEEVDEFCQNWKQIGILFAFKNLCREAITEVTRKSVPFLKATVEDLQQNMDTDKSEHLSSVSETDSGINDDLKNQLLVNELFQAFGLKTKMDSALFNTLESIKLQQKQIQVGPQEIVSQSDELQNELLFVATSYLLPKLVGSSFYRIEYEALEDNVHCTAYAIKELMFTFFCRYGEERLDVEIRKFIGFASSNLLRLGLEGTDNNQGNKEELILIHNRDSIYIFFDFVIRTLENVSDDFYEECFPYALVRQAYHNVVKQSRQILVNAAHPTDASAQAAIEASKTDIK